MKSLGEKSTEGMMLNQIINECKHAHALVTGRTMDISRRDFYLHLKALEDHSSIFAPRYKVEIALRHASQSMTDAVSAVLSADNSDTLGEAQIQVLASTFVDTWMPWASEPTDAFELMSPKVSALAAEIMRIETPEDDEDDADLKALMEGQRSNSGGGVDQPDALWNVP